jgi:hypothetical protein
LRIVVIGGYGFFGRRLVGRLAGEEGLHIVVAGRSGAAGRGFVETLRPGAQARLANAALDVHAAGIAQALAALAPQAVVHTGGPFQGQHYRVAEACIDAGAHYIDLADGREFVAGIGRLGPRATSAGLAVISGASSVPALSSAAADLLARGLVRVRRIDIGISPGNRTERGLSTVRSILGYCGKALPAVGGERRFGWSGSRRHLYPPPVGSRLLSPCDVPDLQLLPARYAGTPTVSFGAGLELALLHRGMNAMAMLARLRVVNDWSAYAGVLKRVADAFKRLGSDAGAMHVTVCGDSADGTAHTRTWQLLATEGDGPFVPTLAAAALIRKLRGAEGPSLVGARPCVGLLSLQDFEREARGLHITMSEAAA